MLSGALGYNGAMIYETTTLLSIAAAGALAWQYAKIRQENALWQAQSLQLQQTLENERAASAQMQGRYEALQNEYRALERDYAVPIPAARNRPAPSRRRSVSSTKPKRR